MTSKTGKAGNTSIEPRWYFVHTYSGQEERVRKNLEQRITTMYAEDKILQVIVPTEEIM